MMIGGRIWVIVFSSFEVVETIAHWPETGFVVSAVHRDAAAAVFDRGLGLGQRDHLPPLQQPAQAGAVDAAQAAVAGVWLLWGLMEAEQVARRPAERRSLLAPAR